VKASNFASLILTHVRNGFPAAKRVDCSAILYFISFHFFLSFLARKLTHVSVKCAAEKKTLVTLSQDKQLIMIPENVKLFFF